MSRYLQLNFEDFGLNQDITKTIQPFSPFCLCCLDREGPMLNLDKCEHSDYLDSTFGFDQAQLKQFNQLICHQCHNLLKKVKGFQQQIYESYNILVSGKFNNTTVNNKKVNSLVVQTVINNLHLPAEEEPTDIITDENIVDNLLEDDYDNEVQNCQHMEENYTHDVNVTDTEEHVTDESTPKMPSKNMRTAIDILQRNNQSFVTLGNQLQFLNGAHLSYLEPSLLSKEILTDFPLVPADGSSTDLDDDLLNDTKSLEIEIDRQDKMFYDSLSLSPDIMEKEPDIEILDSKIEPDELLLHGVMKPKIEPTTVKPETVPVKISQKKGTTVQVIRIKLRRDELNQERVLQAQSNGYLKYKFRCETCIVGFNYKENLDDHKKRKHGMKGDESVTCGICMQVISNSGRLTEHCYRHYTRYDCMQCKKRYHTYDAAIRHSKDRCGERPPSKTAKAKPTPAPKRTKSKSKKAGN